MNSFRATITSGCRSSRKELEEENPLSTKTLSRNAPSTCAAAGIARAYRASEEFSAKRKLVALNG